MKSKHISIPVKFSLLFIFFTVVSFNAGSQVISPFGNSFYLGLGYGFGSCHGTSVLDQPNANNDKGEVGVYAKTFAMTSALSHLFGQDKTGLHFGYYLGCTIGASSSRWYIINPNYLSRDKNWATSFDFMGDLRAGLQMAYYDKNKNSMLGLRYYNCWGGDALRSTFGNNDDAAIIGLFAANNRLGIDLNYATDKTPGFLVDSDLWDYLQCDVRCKIGTFDNDGFAFYLGLRYEHSILKKQYTLLNLPGRQDATANSVLFSLGIAPNKKDKK